MEHLVKLNFGLIHIDHIKTISFESNTNSMPSTCDTTNLCFDVSATNSKKKVYAHLIDSGSKDSSSNTLYDLHIASDASVHIIIGYTANTETIATAMKDTCTNTTAKARIELKQI